MVSDRPPSDGVTLDLPSGWFDIDPTRADVVAEIERVLAGRVDNAVHHALLVQALAPVFIELRAAALDYGLVIAAGFGSIVDESDDEVPLTVTASLAVAVLPEIDRGESVTVEDLLQRALDGGSITTLDTVELPCGPAIVTSAQVMMSHPSWDESVPMHVRRYLVRPPGGSGWVALQFGTPNLALTDDFDVVFDAIARTFRFVRTAVNPA